MAHNIEFESFDKNFKNVISCQDVIDAIDLFFDGPDTTFKIVGIDNIPGRRGSCTDMGGIFKITLSLPTIKDHILKGLRMGGNKPHKNLKMAVLSVLSHEIQHANQSHRFKNQASFWSGNYIGRPCERDARRFADENEDIIEQIINLHFIKPKKVKQKVDYDNVVYEIADVFSFIDGDICTADIIKELKIHDANNAVNVNKIISILKSNNKNIISK